MPICSSKVASGAYKNVGLYACCFSTFLTCVRRVGGVTAARRENADSAIAVGARRISGSADKENALRS